MCFPSANWKREVVPDHKVRGRSHCCTYRLGRRFNCCTDCFPFCAFPWVRPQFDFVDVRDYHSDSFGTRLQYLWLYVLLIKSFMVYLSDLFSAITMLTTKQWSNNIFDQCKKQKLNNCVVVDFSIGKWIFVGCIIFGYLLVCLCHKTASFRPPITTFSPCSWCMRPGRPKR